MKNKLIKRFQNSLRAALHNAEHNAERREEALDRIHDACVLVGLDKYQQRKVMNAVHHELDWLGK